MQKIKSFIKLLWIIGVFGNADWCLGGKNRKISNESTQPKMKRKLFTTNDNVSTTNELCLLPDEQNDIPPAVSAQEEHHNSVISDKVGKPECHGEDYEKLKSLRNLMKNIQSSPIQAYFVPMNDAHQSEYISERDKRITFLSGFRGSAGFLVITENKAALWTDSRYHLQAEQEINLDCWILMKRGNKDVPTIDEWLIDNLPVESKVGVDPFIIESSSFMSFNKKLNKSGHSVVSVKENLVDLIWNDRPPMSRNPIEILDLKFSGKTAGEKIIQVDEKLKQLNTDSIVITALDEVAWLLNLRGSDIEYNPVFFSYIILSKGKVQFFVNKIKITDEILNHLKKENVDFEIRDYDDFLEGLSELVNTTDSKIVISSAASQAIYEAIPEDKRLQTTGSSVIAKIKVIKNNVEAENLRKAHIRDGLAVIRYLHWLDDNIDDITITELSGAAKLHEYRSQLENFKGLSFSATSAVGSNAAIVHYNPMEDTNKQITRDEIYLVDSGGQYLDGTTDITRTMHFGQPTNYEKECFTRVLKGFIGLVTSIFPVNTSLAYFDYVARRHLWQVGLDYGHGTGHGVGAFLNVHEYPPLLSSAGGKDPGALENMFTSNEPGYYQDGQFGIRLEDVIQVVKSTLPEAFKGQGALTFKSITFCPIQTKMIDTSLLTKEEEQYINSYHQMVLDTIGSLLLNQNLNATYDWLVNETRAIHRSD